MSEVAFRLEGSIWDNENSIFIDQPLVKDKEYLLLIEIVDLWEKSNFIGNTLKFALYPHDDSVSMVGNESRTSLKLDLSNQLKCSIKFKINATKSTRAVICFHTFCGWKIICTSNILVELVD